MVIHINARNYFQKSFCFLICVYYSQHLTIIRLFEDFIFWKYLHGIYNEHNTDFDTWQNPKKKRLNGVASAVIKTKL